MAEIIKSGRKYRQKKGTDIIVYSFWTKLKDVFDDDGIDAQTKLKETIKKSDFVLEDGILTINLD